MFCSLSSLASLLQFGCNCWAYSLVNLFWELIYCLHRFCSFILELQVYSLASLALGCGLLKLLGHFEMLDRFCGCLKLICSLGFFWSCCLVLGCGLLKCYAGCDFFYNRFFGRVVSGLAWSLWFLTVTGFVTSVL